MIKTTVTIEGMACEMCEAHISEAVKEAFEDAEKVTSSHKKGVCTFLTKETPDPELLKKTINDTGYEYIESSSEEYEKKGLFGKSKK